MNLTFLHAVPKPSSVVHGIQMEGLYTINTAQQAVTFSYRELVADPSDPTRQTPKPSDVVKSLTVPLTTADLVAITQVVLARAVALSQTKGDMTPQLSEGMPLSVPQPVAVFIAPVPLVAPLASVQMVATVVGCADQSVKWSLLSGAGTLTPAGLYTAGAAAGVAQVFAVSVADPLQSARAEIRVAVAAPAPVVA